MESVNGHLPAKDSKRYDVLLLGLVTLGWCDCW